NESVPPLLHLVPEQAADRVLPLAAGLVGPGRDREPEHADAERRQPRIAIETFRVVPAKNSEDENRNDARDVHAALKVVDEQQRRDDGNGKRDVDREEADGVEPVLPIRAIAAECRILTRRALRQHRLNPILLIIGKPLADDVLEPVVHLRLYLGIAGAEAVEKA